LARHRNAVELVPPQVQAFVNEVLELPPEERPAMTNEYAFAASGCRRLQTLRFESTDV
jgi:hypothetical protein